jgi:predicted DNA-binding transcriptional regulator AlpA
MTDDLPAICFIEHIAQQLGVCTRTLERRIRAGLSMPRELRRIGPRRRWAREDVLAWLQPPTEQAMPTRRAHLRSHLRRTA